MQTRTPRRAWVGSLLSAASCALLTGACAHPRSRREATQEPLSKVSCPEGLRVVTFNIAHGRGMALTQSRARRRTFFERHLDEIAALLEGLDATVVALQEAELGSRWAADFDHVAYLAERAAYPHRTATAHVQDEHHRYGTALLSRLPLHDAGGLTFAANGRWHKGFTHAAVTLGRRRVRVVSVHLDFACSETRRAQADELATVLDREEPTVVAGDFNAVWRRRRETAIERLAGKTGLLPASPRSEAPTHPSTGRRIDWILHDPSLRVQRHTVLEHLRLSDHHPVLADLCWRQQRA